MSKIDLKDVALCMEGIQNATEQLFECAMAVIDKVCVERACIRMMCKELGIDEKE